MHNVIPDRVIKFLRQFPPFDRVAAADLERVATSAILRHLEPGDVLFTEGDTPGSVYYMVFQGAVDILQGDALIDRCDEGDLFGVRPLLADRPYLATARAGEESLILLLDIPVTRDILPRNPDLSLYLASSFASGRRNPEEADRGQPTLVVRPHDRGDEPLLSLQSVQISREPVFCAPGTSIREAARRMSERKVGSILICAPDRRPLGIITDKDLRNRVLAGTISPEAAVEAIMSSPVITAPVGLAVADAMILMLRHRIHHLCLTADGGPDSEARGVISEHDLLLAQGNNPAVLIRDMTRAEDVPTLARLRDRADLLARQYLERDVSVEWVARLLTEINDTLIHQAIRLALRDLDWTPPVPFAWMGLGSEGRGEQLLRSDQDNALVFADPGEHLDDVRQGFLAFARRVNETMHEAGFEWCPAEMMARNPNWCLSLPEWKALFLDWMRSPGQMEVMHANIFFDFRPVYGDINLTRALSDGIFRELERNRIFLSLMARDAVRNPPPLSFFRQFIVEKDGAHKDQFDIKLRAMMPLIDAARVLILDHRQAGINNTIDRYLKLAELEPQQADLYQQAAEAFAILMRFRAESGLKNRDSGRYFHPDSLSKLDRLQLRNAFLPIHDLQDVLRVRFQLDLIPQ